MTLDIKALGNGSLIFGLIAGLWAWLAMFASYMTTTGVIKGEDLLVGLSLPIIAIFITLLLRNKAVKNNQLHNINKRTILVIVWCTIPSALFMLVAITQKISP